MKKSKYTESQIIRALKENESGRSVELIRSIFQIIDCLKNSKSSVEATSIAEMPAPAAIT